MTTAKKPKTKAAMIEYLAGHFRYYTANPWNRATSYARRIKINRLEEIPRDLEDAAYAMLEVPNYLDVSGFSEPLNEFQRRYNHCWQWGTNGRTSGYVGLYQGGIKTDGYKTYCEDCGQGNYKADTKVCGRCHSEEMIPYPFVQTFCWPGKGTDEDETFSAWPFPQLQERFQVVWNFDLAVDHGIANFVAHLRNNEVREEIVMVPKTIHVSRPKATPA